MNPRERLKENSDLPPNLYTTKRGRKIYFYYKHPKTGKSHGMGNNKKKAVDAAKQLNELFSTGRDLVAQVVGIDSPLGDFLDTFYSDILPTRTINGNPLSESTMVGYKQRLNVYRERWGKQGIKTITLREIAAFLDTYTPRMSNMHRSTLILVWRYAKSKGLVDENHPESTIKRAETVHRKPLTIEGFNAIRSNAPAWFQNAMTLALESLQSRSEISSAKFDAIEGNTWKVIRKKTKSHGVSARLEIVMWPELKAAVSSCRDELASPFMVHKKPEKIKPRAQQAKERTHPTQILPEQLSRAFAKARDKTDFYKEWTPEEKPTFHEIRALGADLKRKAGWSEELIQKLMAHSDKEMTAHYLDKHEVPWTKVEVD